VRAILVVVVLAFAACDEPDAPAPKLPPTRAEAAAATAATKRALDDCRDACEQNAIVTQAGDAILRGCRAGCDARYVVPAAPHEVPSRITRSAPAHAAPAVRPR
jgi:hypothetical protein